MGFFMRAKESYQAGQDAAEAERYKRKVKQEAKEKRDIAEARKNPSKWPYRLGRIAATAAPVVDGIYTTAKKAAAEYRRAPPKRKAAKKKTPAKKTVRTKSGRQVGSTGSDFFDRL